MSHPYSLLACSLTLFAVFSAVPAEKALGTYSQDARVFDFSYTAYLYGLPGDAAKIAAWIPFPQSNDAQIVRNIQFESPGLYEVIEDERYGNRFLFVELSKEELAGLNQPVKITINYMIAREPRAGLESAPIETAEIPAILEQHLQPSRLVQSTGPVAEEAQRVAGDTGDNVARARKLYDHIVDTVSYDKSGEGWGRGDSLFACDVRAGNCTDFHSLFIGEARSLGIPARFVMGFSTPTDAPAGVIGGYHCWAEFYDPAHGWIPLDASDASKNPQRRDELFGGLDPDRVQFTVGRDIPLPGMQGEPVNFSIYPYVEVDGVPHDNVRYEFTFRDR